MKAMVQSLKNLNYVKTTNLSVFNFLSLRWALPLSIICHVLLFVVLLSIKIDTIKIPEIKPLEITVIDKVVTFQELKQEIEKVSSKTENLQNKDLFVNAVIKEYSNFEPVEKPLEKKEVFNSNILPQHIERKRIQKENTEIVEGALSSIVVVNKIEKEVVVRKSIKITKEEIKVSPKEGPKKDIIDGLIKGSSYTSKEIKDSMDYTNGQGTKTLMILIHSMNINLPEIGTRWNQLSDTTKKVYFNDINKINQKGVTWNPEGLYSNGEERTKAEADALGGWKNIWIDVILDSIGEDGVRRIYVKFRKK